MNSEMSFMYLCVKKIGYWNKLSNLTSKFSGTNTYKLEEVLESERSRVQMECLPLLCRILICTVKIRKYFRYESTWKYQFIGKLKLQEGGVGGYFSEL